ncbi:hypothetical protein [Persephonella sp.]|nr:hypothetical protein [Persephonella sp.]
MEVKNFPFDGIFEILGEEELKTEEINFFIQIFQTENDLYNKIKIVLQKL